MATPKIQRFVDELLWDAKRMNYGGYGVYWRPGCWMWLGYRAAETRASTYIPNRQMYRLPTYADRDRRS